MTESLHEARSARRAAQTGHARVLLVSQRAMCPYPSRALRFEFEDALEDFHIAEIAAPARPAIDSPTRRRLWRVAERLTPAAVRSLRSAGRAPSHDVVFVAIESLYDLQLLQPLPPLLRQGRTSVCFIDEVWRNGLSHRKGEIQLLRDFDRVLVGCAGAVDAVAELSQRPCDYVPPSVDALALCPFPEPPARCIDVYAMGRRSGETHAALQKFAARHGWFYMYDTVSGTVPDHRQHRRHLADLLKRTRYLLAYPGKIDCASETAGQQEIGFRYFEGAAAGAVLVGERPANPWFEQLFGWSDAVVSLPYGATEVGTVLEALDAAPDRVERARCTNVVESLLRHDHVYRWAEVLRRFDLPETAAMQERRRALADRAAIVAEKVRRRCGSC